eukprot:1189928-Pleurochrysis_carterae.AAC.2
MTCSHSAVSAGACVSSVSDACDRWAASVLRCARAAARSRNSLHARGKKRAPQPFAMEAAAPLAPAASSDTASSESVCIVRRKCCKGKVGTK